MMSDTANRKSTAPSGAIEEELAGLLQLMSRPLGEGGTAQHLQAVAQRVVDGLRRLLGVAGCRLYTVEPFAGSALQPLAASPSAAPVSASSSEAVERALREHRVVNALDGGLVLAVPVRGADRPAGVLEVRRAQGLWTREEVRLVQLFADHAAVALETARLATESRQRRRTAEALALMAQATSRSFDVSTLGRGIVETLLLLLRCARATLFEMVDNGVRLVAVARADDVEAVDDVAGSELGPVETQALRERHLVGTSDFLLDPGIPDAERVSGLEITIRGVWTRGRS